MKVKGELENTKTAIEEMRAKHEKNTAEYDKQIEKGWEVER